MQYFQMNLYLTSFKNAIMAMQVELLQCTLIWPFATFLQAYELKKRTRSRKMEPHFTNT